ncbi:MAG: hypothetical protein R2750_11510 [Bacteroidales bacterium]
MLITVIFFISLFVVPDSKGAAIGFVSSRIVLFFFLFLVVWLSAKKFPTWLNILLFIIIIYVNMALLNIYYDSVKNNNNIAKEISRASKNIVPFSTVLPINKSEYGLHSHISNYLGIDKPMVILENYEASMEHFPLMWNRNDIPNLYLGASLPANDCLTWITNTNNKISVIDYVFIINGVKKKLSEECENKISEILLNEYVLVYKSEDDQIFLYKYSPDN